MTEIIKNTGKDIKNTAVDITERVLSETPTHFVKASNWGLIMVGVGVAVKIVAAIFPATMPIGIVSLMPELITIGTTFVVGAQTAKRDKNDASPIKKTAITKIIDLFR